VATRGAAAMLLTAGQALTVTASQAEAVAGDDTSSIVVGTTDEPTSLAPDLVAHAAHTRNQERTEARAVSAEVRRKLQEGEVDAARSLLRRAERERAVDSLELALLQAEADLAEHRHERAKSRYLAIVAAHPGSSEAELSRFAAAQLSHGPAGIDLLQRYLARYPNGRFAKEAQRLLQALDLP